MGPSGRSAGGRSLGGRARRGSEWVGGCWSELGVRGGCGGSGRLASGESCGWGEWAAGKRGRLWRGGGWARGAGVRGAPVAPRLELPLAACDDGVAVSRCGGSDADGGERALDAPRQQFVGG